MQIYSPDITGSILVTGSFTVTGSAVFSQNVVAQSFTGSLFGTSSYAITASYSLNGGGGGGVITGLSNGLTLSASIGKLGGTLIEYTSIDGNGEGFEIINADSGIYIQSNGGSVTLEDDGSGGVFLDSFGGGIHLRETNGGPINLQADLVRVSGSLIVTGSVSAPNITGSLFGTSSYAITASYSLNGGGSSGRVVSSSNITGATTIDLTTGDMFILTLTGNVTSFNYSNEVVGKDYIFVFNQATTNKTFTWATGKYAFPFGNAPVLTNPTTNGTSTTSSKDIITGLCSEAGYLDIVYTPDLIKN